AEEREGALMLETITSYVAVGDSFSEGLMDPDPHGEDRYRGWADRLALMLTESAVGSPDVSYANLAIRGRLLDRIIDEQIPRALEIRPDLVSLCAGGNDCLRDRKSTRLNSSHVSISYAVFCLKKKTQLGPTGSATITSYLKASRTIWTR